MSSKPQSPCLFGLCNVDMGTLNVVPYHIHHAMAVDNCRVHVVGAGNTWAVCHILARRLVCTHLMRCERQKSLPYVSVACALTLPVTIAQLLFIDCSTVFVKVTPRIFLVWYVQNVRICASSSHC